MSQPRGDPVAQLVDAVRQAKPVAALLGTDAHAVAAAVDGCVARLSDDPIRVVRVRGLPGVPLTLSQIVEDIGANHHDGPRVDDDELIVRVLATRSRGESQVVLLIEQAELLPLPTLAFLQVALAVFGTRVPRLQLLFAGHPKFAHLIDRDELASLRDRLGPVIRVQPSPAGPQPGPATPRHVELGGTTARLRTVASPKRRRWAVVALPALLLVTAAATMGWVWYGAARPPVEALAPASGQLPAQIVPPAEAQFPPQDTQPLPAPASPSQAAKPEAAPPPPSREPDVAAAPVPSPSSREPDTATAPPDRRPLPSSEQLARLRGEFDRFLSQTEWGSKKLSENERSRLFNEYLRWNYGALAATPGTPP